VEIRVAQQELIGKVVDSDHETWNVVVRIFVMNDRDSNNVLVKKHY
jgi:hypothetical protein